MPMSLKALVPKASSHFAMLSVSHNILIISWWVMDPTCEAVELKEVAHHPTSVSD